MTRQDAAREAQQRWGQLGRIFDRADAPHITWTTPRFWVGAPMFEWGPQMDVTQVYGNGDTWEAAFADADRRAGVTR